MPLTYPKRNGYLYTFKSVEVLEGAAVWNGILSVGWTGTMDGADVVHGNKVLPYGHIRGNAKTTLEVKFVAEAYFDWLRDHPGALQEILPAVVVKNQEGSRIDAVKLVGLRFTEVDGPSEGTDANEITKPANALDLLIKTDGGTAFVSVFTGKQEGEE
jgi:hypothetical protein